jgi:hypothetical protein
MTAGEIAPAERGDADYEDEEQRENRIHDLPPVRCERNCREACVKTP